MSRSTRLFFFGSVLVATSSFAACGGDDNDNTGGDGDGNGDGAIPIPSAPGGQGGAAAIPEGGAGGATSPAPDTFCVPNGTSCEGTSIATCNSDGSGFVNLEPCEKACIEELSGAICDTEGGGEPTGDDDLIDDGDFSATGAWALSAGASGPPMVKDGAACLTSSATLGWIGSDGEGLSLSPGDYTLSFSFSGTALDDIDAPSLEAKISPMDPPWTPVYGTETFTDPGTSRVESVSFNVPESVTRLGLAFNIAVFSGDEVCIDDVKLTQQ